MFDVYLRDEPFSSGVGIVELQPTKGTQWVAYINENYFDSYGCAPPQKLSSFNIKQDELFLNSEYKIQGLTNKKDTSRAVDCSYIIYLTKI